MAGLFHLTYFLVSSMLQHVSEFPSYLRSISISLYLYTMFCLSIDPSLDSWVVFTFCYCESCCYELEYTCTCLRASFQLLGVYIHKWTCWIQVLIFWITMLFSAVGTPFYNPTNSTQRLQFLHILTNTRFFWAGGEVFYLIVAIALVRWHLNVILICISVLISDIEHLFICFIYIFLRNV